MSSNVAEDKGDILDSCPNCGSNDQKRLAILYANGLSFSRSGLVGFSLGDLIAAFKSYLLTGALAVIPGVGAILGVYAITQVLSAFYFGVILTRTQSALSEEVEPPKRFPAIKVTIASFGLVASLFWIEHTLYASQNHEIFHRIVEISPLVCLIFLSLGIYYNLKIWPERESIWQRSFMCSRCGTIFLNSNFDMQSISKVTSGKVGKGYFFPRFVTKAGKEKVAAKVYTLDKDLRKQKKRKSID